jgi:integrase
MPKLNARFVETTTKPGRHVDGAGLCLVVAKNGSKKWVLRYQVGGRRRDMGLGAFPAVSLGSAREKAMAARRLASAGGDPIAQRRAQRTKKPIPTFGELAAEVIALEQARSTNEKVRYQWELLLGPAYCALILNRPLNEISTSDVERILRPVWHTKPETARKLHRRIRRVFEHARIRLRDAHGVVMSDNPARWDDLKALGFEAPRKLSRGPQPSLAYRETADFMTALRARQSTAARALELLILTAVRTDAVRRAEWREFDLDAALWTIPIAHLKDKRTRTEPFRVPLAPDVVAMLCELEKKRTTDFLFSGPDGRKPISNMAMIALLRKLNVGPDGLPQWRDPRDGRPMVPHGFRATFRTWAEDETHYPRSVIEQAMGHQVGTEVERAYRRTDVLEKRRSLMSDWAACVDAAREPKIPFGAARSARLTDETS